MVRHASSGKVSSKQKSTDGGGIIRLNAKIESRNLEVKDLVTDLSDGVCWTLSPFHPASPWLPS